MLLRKMKRWQNGRSAHAICFGEKKKENKEEESKNKLGGDEKVTELER